MTRLSPVMGGRRLTKKSDHRGLGLNIRRTKISDIYGPLHVAVEQRRDSSRGQALVELALVTTVMLLLLVGALDLGRVFYGQIAVTDAAKEGALVASQGGTYTASVGAAVTEANGGFVQVSAPNVTVAP